MSNNIRFRPFSSNATWRFKSEINAQEKCDQWKIWYQNALISSGTLLDNSDIDPKLLEFMQQSQIRPLPQHQDHGFSTRDRIATNAVLEQVRRFHQTRIHI